jgi:aryl carrier-like protein
VEPTTNPGEPELRARVAELLHVAVAAVAGDVNLVSLGLTSLDLMRLSSRLRRAGVPVEFATMAAEPTLDAWQRHIDSVQSDSVQSDSVKRAGDGANDRR